MTATPLSARQPSDQPSDQPSVKPMDQPSEHQTFQQSTPPMGWNSWDCYGTTVTEAEVLANADIMAQKLLPYGWDTIVVDIQWYEPNARAGGYNDQADVLLDVYGRQLPVPERFPSVLGPDASNNGFTELARQIHAKGLKFGIHLMRGIPKRAVEANTAVFGTPYRAQDIADTTSTCPWNSDNYGLNHEHPGAQAYYDSQLALFAQWGIDFIKIDDMLFPLHTNAIEGYCAAIAKTGRDITLSLSPGTNVSLNRQPFLSQHATMWRISDDLWDRWEDVRDQFDRLAQWAPHQQPGSWADADMLPLGQIGLRAERGEPRETRLTLDEQRTLMSLWTLAKSPLMMGGDLPSSQPHTFELLTNSRLLNMYRNAAVGTQIHAEPHIRVWYAPARTAPAQAPQTSSAQQQQQSAQQQPSYVAVFNLSDTPRTWVIDLADLNSHPSHTPHAEAASTAQFRHATDVWTGQSHAVVDKGTHPYPHITVTVPAHAVTHLELT